MALHASSVLDTADALEAESVPDAAAGDVRLVNEVEHAGLETQQWRPLEVVAAHDAAAAGATVVEAHEEAGVADVRRAADVVGLDVEAAEELMGAAGGDVKVWPKTIRLLNDAPDHHGDEMREVVVVELRSRELFLVHVRRALFDDRVKQLVDSINNVRRSLLERVVWKDRHCRPISKLVVEWFRNVQFFLNHHCLPGVFVLVLVLVLCTCLLAAETPPPLTGCRPPSSCIRSSVGICSTNRSRPYCRLATTRSVSAFPLSARNAYQQRLGLAGRQCHYKQLHDVHDVHDYKLMIMTAMTTTMGLYEIYLLSSLLFCSCFIPTLPPLVPQPHLAGHPKALFEHDFRYRIE